MATLGIKVAIKIINGLSEIVYYKWTSRFERRAKEIEELNRKMHDRLVELEEFLDTNHDKDKISKTKIRLRYNASRLKKYDKTIISDVNSLLNLLSFSKEGNKLIHEEEGVDKIRILIEQIREKVDKLWFKKS